ncbi:MAG: PAS domain S-box protein [Desulfobacterales bacterium]|nr:PAS domain S-box protein [Desulfobacterales bacterium]MCP4162899.1 PAS domain S-box protein [Deltaproteobacteria bacterium]
MIQDKKIKIGILASSETFSERITSSDANKDLDLYISSIGLSESIQTAQGMVKNGVEVIISRRGTAHILRENLTIPVLSFPHRSLDVLTSLNKAKEYGVKILFPVFRQKIDAIKTLEKLLNIKVTQGIYKDNNSLIKVIEKGKSEGCDVVLGGNLTNKIARDLDMNFVGIDTSNDDIASTIESAKSVALSNREEKAKTQRYRSIIESSNDGIISVDEKENITILNSAAKRILGIEEDVVGMPVNKFITSPLNDVIKTKVPLEDQLDKIQNKNYMSSHLPITLDDDIIGAVSIIQDVSNVMRSEKVVRKSFSKGFVAKYNLKDLIHRDESMKIVAKMCKQFAKTDSSILIIGETGTGKEIVASSIHNLSPRKKHPFVSVNCAALPDQLLESELFGYVEGAFTGSRKGGKPGLFEIAHQGTIFLDEIDSTPLNVQVLLLRVIQEKEVRRIGGEESIPVDVRIVAAGRDLTNAMHSGTFREDLFFRLNVLRISIPALKKRKDDIPYLLRYFIKYFSQKNEMKLIKIPDSYVMKLVDYQWPGNVRQLRNFSEKLVLNYNLISKDDSLEYLYQELIEYSQLVEIEIPESILESSLKNKIKKNALESESKIIKETLEKFRFNKTKTAKELNISRSTLWRKMKDLGIE